MKYKRIIFISLLLSLISLMCLNAISQELPFLMDFAQLKLEVTNTEVVDQISDTGETILADEGDKLVVVTLKGIVPHPCMITIEPRDFSAIYEDETTNIKGEKKISLWVIKASAIGKDSSWSIFDWSMLTSNPAYIHVVTYYIREPGPIIIKMAVILPEQITDFFVRYPVLTKGKATISSQAGE